MSQPSSHPGLIIRITGELCVYSEDLHKLARHPAVKRTMYKVSTPWGVKPKIMAHINRFINQPHKKNAKGKWEAQPPKIVPVLADVLTGTLYDAETGRSTSPQMYIAFNQQH